MGKVLETLNPMCTLPFGNGHIGIDIVGNSNGWGALDGILALEEGTIESMESNCATVYNNANAAIRDWGHSYGCYVLINHGVINGHTYKTRYAHLQYRSNSLLYVGQHINKGQGIGDMGNTGNTAGGHLHFEIIKDGVTIDPYKVIFEGLELKDLDKPPITVPEPVEPNEDVNQVRVVCGNDTLRVRKDHSTNAEMIGFAKPGFYNIISTYEDGIYNWYEVEENKWFASAEGCTVYYPLFEEKEEEPIIEPTIIEIPLEQPKNEEIEPIIEPINKDKKNPFVEFIKWIINLINKIRNK